MAFLKIYDAIVPDEQKEYLAIMGINGVSFKDVDDFLASVPEDDDTLDVLINSKGGDVAEGWAINDKLRASGKRIVTTIEGSCASMASVILLAGSERRAYPHARLLIHDPYLPYVDGQNADGLRRMAEMLDAEKNRILDYYVERTGTDRTVLAELMAQDKYIDMDEAVSLGFIGQIVPPASAYAGADINFKPNNQNMKKDKKKLSEAWNVIASALGLASEPVGFDLKTVDGGTLTIEKESGEPVVGDKASPDGMHKLPDGRTIVVENGEIVQIEDTPGAQSAEDDLPDDKEIRIRELEADVKQRDDQIASLKAQIDNLEERLEAAKQEARTDEDKDILNAVAIAGGKAWLSTVASNYVPKPRAATPSRKNGVEVPSRGDVALQQALAKAREKEL